MRATSRGNSKGASKLHRTKTEHRRIRKKKSTANATSSSSSPAQSSSSRNSSRRPTSSSPHPTAAPRPPSSYTVADSFGPQIPSNCFTKSPGTPPPPSATQSVPLVTGLYIPRTLSDIPIFGPALDTTAKISAPLTGLFIPCTLSNIPILGPMLALGTSSQGQQLSDTTTPSKSAPQMHSKSPQSGHQYSALCVDDLNASLLQHYSQNGTSPEKKREDPFFAPAHRTTPGIDNIKDGIFEANTNEDLSNSDIKVRPFSVTVSIHKRGPKPETCEFMQILTCCVSDDGT